MLCWHGKELSPSMNISTFLGILIGLGLIGGTIVLTADNVLMFLNLPSLIMVLGGTMAATLISYPFRELRNVFKVFGIVLRNERLYAKQDLDELIDVSKLMFQGQIHKADERLNMIRNPFLRTGIQLVLDGSGSDDISSLLQWRIARMRARERAEAQIFRTMAAFAPAFGMLGTLLGLINMLSGMDAAGFEHIGKNMALAMITHPLRHHPRQSPVQAGRAQAGAAHRTARHADEHGGRGRDDDAREAQPGLHPRGRALLHGAVRGRTARRWPPDRHAQPYPWRTTWLNRPRLPRQSRPSPSRARAKWRRPHVKRKRPSSRKGCRHDTPPRRSATAPGSRPGTPRHGTRSRMKAAG